MICALSATHRIRSVLIVKCISNYFLSLSLPIQNLFISVLWSVCKSCMHSTIWNFCNFVNSKCFREQFRPTTTDFMHVLSSIAHSLQQIWVTVCGESCMHMKIDCDRFLTSEKKKLFERSQAKCKIQWISSGSHIWISGHLLCMYNRIQEQIAAILMPNWLHSSNPASKCASKSIVAIRRYLQKIPTAWAVALFGPLVLMMHRN